MKSRLLLWICVCACTLAAQYQQALPGYRYEFPRDHFSHPEYQTEWWYYTGNVHTADGHRFGFELTFFREGVDRGHKPGSSWAVSDLYLAHLALTDVSGGRFRHTERLNRAGPGLAGVDAGRRLIWNGNWQVELTPDVQKLQGITSEYQLDLTLWSDKPPVIHGQNGVSQKSEGAGKASHYISFTRLLTSGTIQLDGVRYEVEGTSWMDHEFFTAAMEENESGWDWLSIQLDDGSELMLYRLRRKDGSVEPYSSGTFVAADGRSTALAHDDFSMDATGETWTSPQTRATYPIGWRVKVMRFGLDLRITAAVKAQELASRTSFAPSYWEGAIDVSGARGGSAIHGAGYLELTGYDHALSLSH
ncbi:MAG: lipocalin-like domain-containing protein [Acidobacteriaceae bacterium]